MSLQKYLEIEKPLPFLDVNHFKRKYLDVSYANQSYSQKLDLYLPDSGNGPFPLIIHIHGGAFKMCDKRDLQLRPFLRAINEGYAVASINYRMSGESIFPAAVHDCKCAIRYLKANKNLYNIDSQRIAVVGGSAGGHLGLMVSVHSIDLEDFTQGNSHVTSRVNACVSWFPAIDFINMDNQFKLSGLGPTDHDDKNSPESLYLGGEITKLDTHYVKKSNPTSYLGKEIIPILIQHGNIDHLVPHQQSINFMKSINETYSHHQVEFDLLNGADHADPKFETKENMDRVFDFLNRHMKVKPCL